MTWASTIAEGRGEVAYRLEIERLGYDFVTHPSMAGSVRLPWLSIGGKLKCISNPISAEIEVSGLTATILDKDGGATAIFAKEPPLKAWLTSTILNTETTTMPVRSTAGWPTKGVLWINSEAIYYASKTATSFDTLTRGYLSSLAQSHYTEALGSARYPEITSTLPSVAGCRARLYAYGQNDSPTGDGTQIWLGVVTRHPTFTGSSWSMMIDPITSILSKSLAADMQQPAGPRGIKYDWYNAIGVQVRREDTGELIFTRIPGGVSERSFFENNDDFCSYLSTKLATAVAAAGWDTAFGCSIRAIAEGDSSWHLGVTTDGTREVTLIPTTSAIDPAMGGTPTTITSDLALPVSGVERYWLGAPSGGLQGRGSVPRGFFGSSSVGVGGPFTSADAHPINVVYVAGAGISSAVDSLAVSWKEGDQPAADTYPTILTTDASNNSVMLDADAFPPGFAGSLQRGYAWTAANAPEFRFGRTYTGSGNIYTALVRIISLAPTLLNFGGVPDLRSGDLDGSAWNSIDSSSQPRIVRSRRFTSYSDEELLTIVKQELLLAGFMLGTTSTGKIAIAPIRGIARTELADLTIADVVDVPTWEPSAYGMVNQVSIQRGYNQLEDEYTAPRVLVRDVAEFGRNPRPRTLSIEPKSVPAGPVESFDECVEVAQRVFSVFSGPYAILNVKTPLTSHNTATVGAVVSLTSPHIPDYETGTMGVTGLRCIVFGREIDLAKGVVSLRLYATLRATAGYVPSGLIEATANVGGDTWNLDIDPTYIPTGSTADDWFTVGDLVQAVQWDVTADTRILGTVTSVTSNTVQVGFASSAAALVSNTWYLTAQYATAALSAEQKRFAFLADTDMAISFASGDVPARVFS